MKTRSFLLAAGVSLAMAFTFSCSSDAGNEPPPPYNGGYEQPSSSSLAPSSSSVPPVMPTLSSSSSAPEPAYSSSTPTPAYSSSAQGQGDNYGLGSGWFLADANTTFYDADNCNPVRGKSLGARNKTAIFTYSYDGCIPLATAKTYTETGELCDKSGCSSKYPPLKKDYDENAIFGVMRTQYENPCAPIKFSTSSGNAAGLGVSSILIAPSLQACQTYVDNGKTID